MREEQLIQDLAINDEQYNCYHPSIPLQIFHSMTDVEDCEIYVAREFELSHVLPLINDYLEWLKNCSNEVIAYFSQKSGEHIGKDWFETLEVYSVSLTINSLEDFGATVSFGESIFIDHIMEFDFEKFCIVDDRFNG